jgi:hypothetical protein
MLCGEDVIYSYSLTNDLKKKNPQQCVNDLFELVTTICAKWPLVKVVISFTTPRCDTLNNSTSAQIINVLLSGIVYGLFVLVICFWNGAVAVVCPKQYGWLF